MVSRRKLLTTTAASIALATLCRFVAGESRRKPPFRILYYNNDATNTARRNYGFMPVSTPQWARVGMTSPVSKPTSASQPRYSAVL